MKNRRITEYGGIILVLIAILFAYMKIWWLCIPLFIIWYFLFGFVGLAYTISTIRILPLSNIFLAITFPVFLLPFRKAFYYWTKSVNVSSAKPVSYEATTKALEYAAQVNPDNLYTHNNKAVFFSFLAALYFDAGNGAMAKEYLDKSSVLPHKRQLDVVLEKLYAKRTEE